MKVQTINPATEENLNEYEVMSQEKVLAILDDINDAYNSWKKLSIKERAGYFTKLAEVLRNNKEKYAELMSKEMGKPVKDALGEVEKCALCCDVFVEKGEEWLADEILEADGKEHKVIYQPLGVILAVMPWNFPFWQVFRFAIPTLLAGNGGILKHASNVTGSALLIEESFREAGFPKNIFRTIIADHDTTAKVMESEHVKGVSLTGSTNAGKRIAEAAGRNLKKVVLELGGSDAFIILEDADLEIVAKNAILGRFQNNGQSCIAAKRFIVRKEIAEEFANKFADLAKKMIVGDPFDENTKLGSLVNEQALNDIDGQVKDAVSKGAKVLAGGKKISGKGYFYEPTVITNTHKDMEIVHEETFGPVAAIIEVETDEEAIQIANSSEFGLGGSVWTKDLERGKEIAKQVETGCIFVNSITKSDPRLPFGGIKESGIGRELSQYGIKEFVNVKGFNVYEHK
ncbi:NAD-dependent succinate-semialdehyde dehydrogenase [Candidatus Woesearchaeota archaeon]|nr:NAD-dependent succinate-semialdehyde dehydrogenase [Candidatus Woesearchaeota archaeon]